MEVKSAYRLASLDGLRALAAIGVLWIHTWMVHGTPRLKIWSFDFTNLLAIGGNGVDLFFVISGFCMYYFYNRDNDFSGRDFKRFLFRRWKRLSPAFYVATLIYIIWRLEDYDLTKGLLAFFTSFFYANSFSSYNPEGFFWSLSPEWQFYMLIPILFIVQNRYSFFRSILLISCLMFIIAVATVIVFKSGSDIYTGQIFFRYFEFFWGIIVAHLCLRDLKLNHHRWLWFILAVVVAYAGRILLSNTVLSLSVSYYNIFKLVGFTVMSLGFSLLLYLTVTSTGYLEILFGNAIFSFIGKISYSFYLWHGIAHVVVSKLVIKHMGYGSIGGAFVTFIISFLTLIPVSYLSYRLLEIPFLKSKKARV